MALVPASSHPLSADPASPGAREECVVVRSATAEDAARVLVCAQQVFQTSPYVLTSPGEFTMTEAEEREFIQKLLDHPRQIMVIAEHAGAVVGILVLTQNTAKRKMRHSVLLGMSVLKAYRGRRVGTALMKVAVEWAVAHPEIKLMTLAVYAANAAGRALYKRFGFEDVGMVPGGLIHDDGTMWDQYEMYRKV